MTPGWNPGWKGKGHFWHLLKPLVGLALGVLLLPGAQAQDQDEEERPRPRLLLGPNLGAYFPTNDRARQVFGSTFTNIGLGLGRISVPGKGVWGVDFSILGNKGLFAGGDRKALLVPLGLIYARRLTPVPAQEVQRFPVVPYAGASVNLFLTNLRADNFGVASGWRNAYGGSAFLGVTIGQQYFAEGRYYALTEVRDFDLSGWNLSVGARF